MGVCSIPKGVQLLTRLLPLLPHETGSWTSAHEMIMAMLLNGQRISQLCENEVQQKLVAPICAKIGAMDLLAVRNLLKKALDVLQSSTDAGASSVFSPIGVALSLVWWCEVNNASRWEFQVIVAVLSGVPYQRNY